MGVPRLAKHAAGLADAAAGSISADKIAPADTLTIAGVVGNLTGDVTGNADTATLAVGVEHGSGADILIATLTTAFGDPATLADGTLFTYAETTSNPDKIYLVAVVGDAFWVQELTAAAAA